MNNVIEIHKSNKVALNYDKETGLLISTYNGVFNLKKTIEAYSALDLDVVRYKIADVRKLSGSFMKIIGFYNKTYPVLKANGLLAQAIIVGNDLIVNNMTAKLCDLLTKLKIECKTFTSEEDAYSWIAKLQK